MTIGEAKILIKALETALEKSEKDSLYYKKQLDSFKPKYEDGTATELDRQQAHEYEHKYMQERETKTTLMMLINTINEREITLTL